MIGVAALPVVVLIVTALAFWRFSRPVAVDPEKPLAGIPIHVMEYHLWWNTPHFGPPDEREWSKWNDPARTSISQSIGPAWRRNTGSGATPLIGCYNSAHPEVIRWQLRCARAAGIAALQVNLFPQPSGEWFGREALFGEIVRLAGEEKMPVYIHDEVQFRGPPAGDADVMAARLIAAVQRFGNLPGYCKIDGKPAISFQYWKRFAEPSELTTMAAEVNEAVPGGVYFVVNAAPWFRPHESMGGFVVASSSSLIKSAFERDSEVLWERLDRKFLKTRLLRFERALGLVRRPTRLGLWAYPGFDDTKPESWDEPKWLPRGEQVATLRGTLQRYAAERPDFILLSSWNDWQENSALEPALDVDGFDGDPYQALRAIAALQGRTFTPPPLPPPEAMDPWIAVRYAGKDATPPRAGEVHREADAVRFTVVDETSPVTRILINEGAVTIEQPYALNEHGRKAADLAEALTIPLEPEYFQKDEPSWLVVTIWDGSPGVLRLSYPTDGSEAYDPTDEKSFPRDLFFRLLGVNRWRTILFELPHFKVTDDNRSLTVHPLPGALISAASVFRTEDLVSESVAEVAASPGRHVVTARASTSRATGPHYIITAEDASGNRMLPVAIDLGATPGRIELED